MLTSAIDLPYPVKIRMHGDTAAVSASIVQLDTTDAMHKIDNIWWQDLDQQTIDQAEDSHWRWADIVQRYRYSYRYDCVAVQDPAESYQGAMVACINAESALAAGHRAVMIQYLATAPRNRPLFSDKPIYRNVGKVLIEHAIRLSYEVGLRGRVNGYSLPEAEKFYCNNGFIVSEERSPSGLSLVEMPPDAAMRFIGNNHVKLT